MIDEVCSCVLFTLWFRSFYLHSRNHQQQQHYHHQQCGRMKTMPKTWWKYLRYEPKVCAVILLYINHKVHPSNRSIWLKFGFVFRQLRPPHPRKYHSIILQLVHFPRRTICIDMKAHTSWHHPYFIRHKLVECVRVLQTTLGQEWACKCSLFEDDQRCMHQILRAKKCNESFCIGNLINKKKRIHHRKIKRITFRCSNYMIRDVRFFCFITCTLCNCSRRDY